MQIRLASSLVALTALLVGACSSDDAPSATDGGTNDNSGGHSSSSGGSVGSGGRSSGGSGGSGGTSGSSGGSGSGGKAGGSGGSDTGDSGPPDGGDGACTVSGTDLVSDDVHSLSNLSFTGDRLVFLSYDSKTLTNPATIDTVHLDGTGRTSIYTPKDQRRVSALVTHGSVVYFLEIDNAAVDPKPQLFKMPIAGGTATPLGTGTFTTARFVGADDTNLYLAANSDQPVGAKFTRVNETTGAVATAATLAGVGTVFYPQLSGDSVFFVSSTTADPITTNAYGFPKDGANVTPTKLWSANPATDTCWLGLGGFAATPTKLACGLQGVESHARTGGPATVVIPKNPTRVGNQLVASDGENLYLNAPPTTGTGVGGLYRVPTSGSPITPIACDVRTLQNHQINGSFRVQNEFEVITGDDQLYWIEWVVTDAGSTWTIRHAPK